MEKEKQWVDQCTSIKPGSDNYKGAQQIVAKTGCSQQNQRLGECLTRNKKDWRQCKEQTNQLSECLKKAKK